MRKTWGYILVVFGLFMFVGVLMNAGEGHGLLTMCATVSIVGLLPVGLGVRLLRGHTRPALANDADRAWESELMRLAERRGGGLTVAEVLAYADLDAERAERILDELCRRGLAEHRITDDGQIVYRFDDAPTVEQKLNAEGVLD